MSEDDKFRNRNIQHLFDAMSRYVLHLPRAVAIHFPVFKDGNVTDIKFIWGNEEFHNWRTHQMESGALGSETRQNFDSLLLSLQEAYEEGNSIQYYKSSDGVETETVWTHVEDVILEWGDDIASKIKFGSAIEKERHQASVELVEAERDIFIQEIHDNVLQDLHVITMDNGTVLASLDTMDKGALQEAVWKNQLQLQKAQNDLRALITQEQARSDPLVARLKSLTEFFSDESTQVELTVNETEHRDADVGEALSQEEQNDLFYVIKEAVSNAKKHSGGTTIKVEVLADKMVVFAVVTDNGKGIDDVTIRSSGTKNMERRLARIGGRLTLQNCSDITKAPATGLRVTAQIDLEGFKVV